MRMSTVAAATIVMSMLALDNPTASAQPMPPSQPAVPQTMPPAQMPPEKVEPNHMPTSNPHRNLGEAPSAQPLTPGQPASPTQPVAPNAPDMRSTPTAPAGAPQH